ncbi:MAG: glycosyltransferase family 4 protein [Saprospiraceae bacterium]
MRIALNTRFLLKNQLEGVGWFTYEIAKRLVERHPECEFIFFFDRDYEKEYVFGKTVTPVVLFPPARMPILWKWWFEISIPWALKKYHADVFLSFDGYCSLRAKTPTVIVTHDVAYLHMPNQIPRKILQYYQQYTPRFLQRAERIITVSEYSKKDILQHFEIPTNKIAVTCNGCKAEFKPLKAIDKQAVKAKYATGEDYFLYVGSVHPRKNVHRLIQAFDQFKKNTQSPIKLLIGGRFAWQTGEVKDAYDNALFKNDITLLGYVSDEELPRLTGAALALVYVSLFEGFGVPLLEAMHCNVPVITSNVSSLPEVAGEAALLVNPYEVPEIANAMQQLYENPDLRQDLVEKGKMQREKFTWEKATDIVWQNILLALQSKHADTKTQ